MLLYIQTDMRKTIRNGAEKYMKTERGIFELAAIPEEARRFAGAYESSAGMGSGERDERMDRLLEILEGVPEASGRMRELGIPEQIIRDTFADIGLWVKRCMRETGGWGLADPSPGWLKNHISCKIFRVGRFQCIPKFLPEPETSWNIKYYRNKNTGHVLAVTARGADFRGDGQVSGTNNIHAGADGFKGWFKKGENFAEGVVISPYGHAVNKSARLDFDQWEEILAAGMPVLDLHIPTDGGFTPDICRRTFESMADFAANHREAIAKLTGVGSDAPFTAFTLGSWLLDAQLDGILPPESNLVRHLREFYLLPVPSYEDAGVYWIFDKKKPDLNNLKPDDQYTSLQRAVIKFMKEGGHMRYNFGVLIFDDVKNYGGEFYRRGFDAMNF
jgi:hypothetical protein